MILGLSLAASTVVHLVISLIAIATGLIGLSFLEIGALHALAATQAEPSFVAARDGAGRIGGAVNGERHIEMRAQGLSVGAEN